VTGSADTCTPPAAYACPRPIQARCRWLINAMPVTRVRLKMCQLRYHHSVLDCARKKSGSSRIQSKAGAVSQACKANRCRRCSREPIAPSDRKENEYGHTPNTRLALCGSTCRRLGRAVGLPRPPPSQYVLWGFSLTKRTTPGFDRQSNERTADRRVTSAGHCYRASASVTASGCWRTPRMPWDRTLGDLSTPAAH